jgi:uncharacterized membrane protein YgdD (TMEM256/DUF423 family)
MLGQLGGLSISRIDEEEGMLKAPIVLAGATGAGGVILAAVSAHLATGTGLESAAYMLLFHAAAILGATAALQQGLLWRPLAGVALTAWLAGGILFSGDLALRALAGHRLFPMAAPSGGTLLISGWVLLAVAAMLSGMRSK